MAEDDWQRAVAAVIRARSARNAQGGEEAAWRRLGGRDPTAIWSCTVAGARYFVKTAQDRGIDALDGEADGLVALAATRTIRVPEVVAHAMAGHLAFLALEWLDFVPGGRDDALGRALARLHRTPGEWFGWRRNNTIGATPQINPQTDDWAAFFRDARLAPQLALAGRNRLPRKLLHAGDALLGAVPSLLSGHRPVPSLLHGDLWSGNAGRLASGEPVVFDPSVSFGDREADLAMTELFGGFDDDFYAAYHEEWPLDDGYPERRTLYNLYHVLNHANLFGGGYVAQAGSMIDRLLADRR